MEMLAWLESSALARWVVESESLLALPTVLTLHTMGLAILVGSAWVLDLRLLGLWRQIPLAAMRVLYRPMWIGLGINTATGILLFMSQATERGTSPTFFTKMFFVACGVSTLVLIQRHVYGPAADPEKPSGMTRSLAIGSMLAWTAAVTAGRMLGYIFMIES